MTDMERVSCTAFEGFWSTFVTQKIVEPELHKPEAIHLMLLHAQWQTSILVAGGLVSLAQNLEQLIELQKRSFHSAESPTLKSATIAAHADDDSGLCDVMEKATALSDAAAKFWKCAWRICALNGWCDEIGGAEYTRCFSAWVQAGAPLEVVQWIRLNANPQDPFDLKINGEKGGGA